MNKKVIVIVISLIITVVLFTGLITIQKKIVNPSGTEKVYVVAKNIEKNTVIADDKDIDTYFKLKEISKDQIIEGTIKDRKELVNTYAKENLFKNEPVISNRIGDNTKRLSEIVNKREVSIKFSDIGEVVGGILKEGDLIDIIFTENASGKLTIKTETALKNVYIDKVFSADGNRINRKEDSKIPATILNVIVSAENAHALENKLAKGKIKVMKVTDDSNYNDILIETTK